MCMYTYGRKNGIIQCTQTHIRANVHVHRRTYAQIRPMQGDITIYVSSISQSIFLVFANTAWGGQASYRSAAAFCLAKPKHHLRTQPKPYTYTF